MASAAGSLSLGDRRPDLLSGTPRAHAIDRWIYVCMAAFFIVLVLAAFIPDSLEKIEAVKAGRRPPFPLVMHIHALLMGSFLLLLLTQTILVARGRCDLHRQLGIVGMVLAPALVIVGFILAPTIYHSIWSAAQFGPPPVREALAPVLPRLENILLLQIRVGILFSLFIALGLRARGQDAGFHKRMMILGTATALGAAIDRMAGCRRRCRQARSRPISTPCWRCRRCWCGTSSATAPCTAPIGSGFRSRLPRLSP